MTHAPRPRGRPRDEAVEEKVLDAAAALEAELGFERTSIEAIAERAGVAKTAIYRRWPNKGVLMFHAVLGRAPTFADITDTGDLLGDLLAVLKANTLPFHHARTRELLGALLGDALRDDRLAALLREQFFGPRADAIARRVTLGVERGEVAPTVDADLVPALLTGPISYLWIVRGSALDDAELRRVVAGVIGPHLRR